jgi:hypothetical protein
MGDFMNQVAQFTMLERMISLQQSMEAIAVQQGHTQALSLLNKQVEVNVGFNAGTSEAPQYYYRGEVTAVRFVGGEPMLTVGGMEFPLSSGTRVGAAAGSSAEKGGGAEKDNSAEKGGGAEKENGVEEGSGAEEEGGAEEESSVEEESGANDGSGSEEP